MLNSSSELNYDQLKILVAHKQADQVLSHGMAKLLIGAAFSSQFTVLEKLRSDNAENCRKALVEAGVNELYLGQWISRYFAEAFSHYWPEEEATIQRHMEYLHNYKLRAAANA